MAFRGFRNARRIGEVRVGDATRGLVGRLDKDGSLTRARAVVAWREAAGEEVAAHARGFAIHEDELIVFVDTAIWANELSALSEHYRTAVNDLLGSETVRSVRFTVSKHVAEEKAWDAELTRRDDVARVERVAPVPATQQEVAQVTAMAAPIHDDGLREAAIGAALRHLEWQKGKKARKSPQAATEGPEGPKTQPEP